MVAGQIITLSMLQAGILTHGVPNEAPNAHKHIIHTACHADSKWKGMLK